MTAGEAAAKVERSVAGVRLGNLGRALGEVGWYAAGSGAGYPGAANPYRLANYGYVTNGRWP